MNENKLQIHLKCKTKCRKMLITNMSVYMVFHPRACGKYSMVKDTVIFFTEDLAVEFAVVEET